MRIVLVLFSVLLFSSCKKNKTEKLTNISGDCIIEKDSIIKQNDVKEDLIRKVEEKKVIKKNLLPEKINIKSFEEEPFVDILINRDDIIEYLDFNFNYPKISIEKNNDLNKIIFSDDNIKVTIKKERFIKKENYNEEDFHGVNYNFPIELISSIDVSFNEIKIEENKFHYNDLAEPNFKSSNVYKINNENIIIEMYNSDGAGGYAVYFFINKNNSVKRYIVYP